MAIARGDPPLAGNQCENCHGPGSKHVSEPDNVEFKKAITVNAGQANTSRLCYRCHDAENSLHFEFAKYWDKIVHNELDDYDDPSVHRPFVPKVPGTGLPSSAQEPFQERNPRHDRFWVDYDSLFQFF